jgi:DHA2 family multidrug resistance protein
MRLSAPLTLEELRARHGARYRWLVLLTVMVGMMASIVSATIVNVAIPDMSRYFRLAQDRAQWVSAAFMVSMTLSLTLTPWLLQRFGLRRTYAGATALLMAGGIAGGLSRHFAALVAARAAEGIAAGVLQPIPNIVILRAFGLNEQGRAMGIFGFGVVLAPAIGPSIGGLLVQQLGWRSIFFALVPFCLIALELTRRFLPTVSTFVERGRRLDWIGLAWVSTAVLCVLNGLVELGHAGLASPWLLLAIGAAGLALFPWYELGRGDPLLELRLFWHRQFAMGATVAFIYGIGIYASTYLLPVFLQMALRYSPTISGLALLPAGLALAATMPFAGRLADRLPPSRLVTFGVLLLAGSLVLMASVGPKTALATLIVWIVIGRVGLGFILPALSLGSVRGLPGNDIPQAASMTSFVRQLGGALGVSLVGIVLEWRLAAHGAAAPARETVPPQGIPAFQETFLFFAALSACAALAAWYMEPRGALSPPADPTR